MEQKVPNDLDLITFIYRPPHAMQVLNWQGLVNANLAILERGQIKHTYRLDALFVDLNGDPEFTIEMARYFVGLFSHRRGDNLWKGMLKVRLENAADDADASLILGLDPDVGGVAAP
ncbi:hypothetical protein [Mesorhizobium sp. YR577]|uniref:DUF6932 family protein n=1 Tax=Mesorhizobium sp. YR577 TaxID=1884373 RepID=UPI001114D8F1|nr:hypothetical protein [Mesorhizobium sp. YR577]